MSETLEQMRKTQRIVKLVKINDTMSGEFWVLPLMERVTSSYTEYYWDNTIRDLCERGIGVGVYPTAEEAIETLDKQINRINVFKDGYWTTQEINQ